MTCAHCEVLSTSDAHCPDDDPMQPNNQSLWYQCPRCKEKWFCSNSFFRLWKAITPEDARLIAEAKASF